MPRVKPSSYNLRKETCFKPKINPMRFKNSFINCLVFKYELAILDIIMNYYRVIILNVEGMVGSNGWLMR